MPEQLLSSPKQAKVLGSNLQPKKKLIPDPGPDRYDEKHEDMVRHMIEVHASYAEDGPTFDPAGDYLCGTCNMRGLPSSCAVVDGYIVMETMGCRRWEIGKPMPTKMGEKSSPQSVGLSEVHSGGFGCHRCEYGAKAKAPDSKGRPLWCGDWGCHVEELACCDEQDQKGLILVV